MGKSKKKSKKRSKVAVPLTAGDLVKAAKRRAAHAESVLAKTLRKQEAALIESEPEVSDDEEEEIEDDDAIEARIIQSYGAISTEAEVAAAAAAPQVSDSQASADLQQLRDEGACFAFQRGECTRGDTCRFAHGTETPDVAAARLEANQAAKEKRISDAKADALAEPVVVHMSIADLLQQAQRNSAKAMGRDPDASSKSKKKAKHEDVATVQVESTTVLSTPAAIAATPTMSLGSSLMQIRAQLQPRASAAASVFVQGQRVASTTVPRKRTRSSDETEESNEADADADALVENNQSAVTQEQEEDDKDASPARTQEAKVTQTLAEDAESWRLDERLVNALSAQGLKEFFPIQRIAVPAILATDQSLGGSGNDVCINAPTGSGKTLVYAVPVVQLLCTRIVPRLRALVIVPSRELATQVHTVFTKLCSLTSLRVEVLTGHDSPSTTTTGAAVASRDILVATPGRLMDLLAEEGPVLFRDLRFLIVDEADRLMSQSYQDWLRKVLDAVRWSGGNGSIQRDPLSGAVSLCIPGGEQDVHSSSSGGVGGVLPPTLRRILCSATLTRNPQKLTALALRDPLLFSSSAGDLPSSEDRVETDSPRYSLPDGLTENMVLCSTENKAQLLVHLLVNVVKGRTLVFTSSLKSTTRVALLLKQLRQLDGKVVEISSRQTQAQRTKYLARFREGTATVLIASDVMARGIDIANLENVVSYDVPSYIKTYVHRVGRTARAGATGNSFTLVRRDQARHFRLLFRKTGRAIKPMPVDKVQMRELRETFEQSVKAMKQRVNKDE